MLKIECSSCKEWIHLPFNSQMEETRCPLCSISIPVKDVYISAGPYLIFKDVLRRNFFKYKKLLHEAERDIEEIRKGGEGLRPSEISINSINLFISNLKEMLDGCRENLRHTVEGEMVRFTVNDRSYAGRIVNISLSGICIETERGSVAGGPGSGISIIFRDEKTGKDINIRSEVMWAGKGSQLGIRFLDADEASRRFLQEFILEKNPSIRKKTGPFYE